MAFFAAATLVAAAAAFTLLVPGTAVDAIWREKERDYHVMLEHRAPIGLGFALLAVLLGLAAIGWARRRRWGWLLSVFVFGVNLIADLAAFVATPSWSTLLPIAVEGLILTWIVRPHTRSKFS